jgi:K(+)-stimulated pyrophosphate-energized sodium pump
MGADLVGKVEAGIPEDDPRNAAVVADLVGDNVGDCAGRGADLFESTAAENIGAMILGVALFTAANAAGLPHPEYWVLFPLVVRAFGIFATGIGILSVRGSDTEDPMTSLNKGYFISVVLSIGFLALTTNQMLGDGWLWFFLAGLVGIITSVAFVFITQYYTEHKYRPVQEIANSARTGPATVAVQGMAVGLESTALTAITVTGALLASYWLGQQADLPGDVNGGLFGTAVATMGMLMTAAYILAMDTFGPITDNAAGVIEMSGSPESARHVTDKLDAVGNTTKALTKGYAVGSAALAAFLLFTAYMDEVHKVTGAVFDSINLAKVEVFVGALLGAMLVFLFSAMAIRAVGKAAGAVIEEVRRQFREDPGIMTGKSRPDFARCVDITAKAGLREMLLPGIVAVGMPILVGLVLRAEAVGAFLMVGTIAGLLMATVLNNSGGAWDNAKKYVESGAMKVNNVVIKKGTPIHAAAVVGDTIGDPYKDTAGPSLHVLVKLLATITLVLAPIFI